MVFSNRYQYLLKKYCLTNIRISQYFTNGIAKANTSINTNRPTSQCFSKFLVYNYLKATKIVFMPMEYRKYKHYKCSANKFSMTLHVCVCVCACVRVCVCVCVCVYVCIYI